ncbi:hypothetical protein Bhyg_13577 [Pseudolycoriella hygida]|uniref:Uncharacterized protein n=1 Tax=Pseudolycoriella hygida TaxID=35572 RepID=A0A9Q0MPU7_9DIPT|nr:hypothetical protein Bhyg_13577 [Pseudolycoriella hygida]
MHQNVDVNIFPNGKKTDNRNESMWIISKLNHRSNSNYKDSLFGLTLHLCVVKSVVKGYVYCVVVDMVAFILRRNKGVCTNVPTNRVIGFGPKETHSNTAAVFRDK